MKRQFRNLALFACISAVSALGVQVASADTGAQTDRPAKCDKKQHRHDGRGGEHRRGHFFEKIAKELGLNDQQKSQAKAILEKSRAENKPYFSALMTERHQMRELMLSGNADEAAIRAQSAKIAAAEADLAVQRSKEAKQLLALLTPEQKTKLKTILDKKEQKFRNFSHGDEHPME